jgi:putative ABC transport system ATP-binding protein
MSELTLEHVSYHYKNGERLALNDVSCTFESGKLYAVVGPSGSGKTTLLSIMAGLDQPSDGKISVDGEDLKNLDQDRYRRERASMIFQAFQLFPLLTVLENVCYPMEMNNVPVAQAKKRAKELLDFRGNRGGKTETLSFKPFGRGAAARGDCQSPGFRRADFTGRRTHRQSGC